MPFLRTLTDLRTALGILIGERNSITKRETTVQSEPGKQSQENPKTLKHRTSVMNTRNQLTRRTGVRTQTTPVALLLQTYLDAEDFTGVGNLMMEILMRPHQERHPDEDARLLARRLGEIVGCRFGIPATWTYPSPHRDRHIDHRHRGSWARDTYVELIITAYVLGSTRLNLPSPHDQLVIYYRNTASDQVQQIEQAAAEYRKHAAAADSVAQAAMVEAEIQRVQQSNDIPQHLRDEEIAALKKRQQPAAHPSYQRIHPSNL